MNWVTHISKKNGETIRINDSIYYGFTPNNLPLEINYNSKLINLLAESSRSLAELSQASYNLKNARLLIVPYLKKEAILSSKMEGTRTTLDEVFKHDAKNFSEKNDDLEEVVNYIKALEYGLENIKVGKFSNDLIIQMHKILLNGVRGRNKDPGKYKTEPNWIGSSINMDDAKFITCPPKFVEDKIKNLISYLNENNTDDHLLKIAIAHYQFETIHPFRDGNGRLGRVLITLYLCNSGLLKKPLLYLSGFFDSGSSNTKLGIMRFTKEGYLDTTFGTNGRFSSSLNAVEAFGNNIVFNQTTKKILVGGYSTNSPSNFNLLQLALTNSPSANICFVANTPILTDQGFININCIKSKKNTINGQKIIAVTETITPEKFLVCFEKDSIEPGLPSKKTTMTMGHKIFYAGAFVEAIYFTQKFKNVNLIDYEPQHLYNILLATHSVINVNNLVAETLHPENAIAQKYNAHCFKRPSMKAIIH
jgi:Fic family protein